MIPHGPNREVAVVIVLVSGVPIARRWLLGGGEPALDGAEAAVAAGRVARSVSEPFQAMQHLRRRIPL